MRHQKTLTAVAIVAVLLTATFITSCSNNPVNSSNPQAAANLLSATTAMKPSSVTVGGPPGYEYAYVNDTTVLINAIEVKQNPTQKAWADFYEVVYPFNPATGQELTEYWPSDPQCNPCDHQHNGITPDDFHDHILDSRPSDPTGHEYNALWHVFVIMPNYTNDAAHNTAVNEMLQSMLPVKSEAEVDALTSTTVDGMPLANEIDTHFYFICDVVGDPATRHTFGG
jgi:hypothetical protein